MRMIAGLFIMIFFFYAGTDIRAETRVDMGVSIGDGGLKGFYLSVSEHYRVPEKEVIVIRKKGIPDDELPVVFFIAERARVAPSVIIDMRLSGSTWFKILFHYHISPEVLYVPVKVSPGPPYGKAYGHYKKKSRKEWNKIMLEDDDVVNLVNLRFISDYHGIAPDRVIHMRAEGRQFMGIDDDIRKEKRSKGERGKEKHGKGDHGKGRKDK